MKKFNVLLMSSVLMSLFSLNSAMAGGEGHGGAGVLCPKKKVQLAEYYETKLRPGLQHLVLNETQEDVDQQIENALKKLEGINKDIKIKLGRYARLIKETALNNPLQTYDWGLVPDVNRFPLEEGCELRTIVYYYTSSHVEYLKPLYDQLSPSQKAGLWVHEAVYRLVREVSKGEIKVSLPARRIVQLLMNSQTDLKLLKEMTNKYLNKETASRTIQIIDEEQTFSVRVDLETPGYDLSRERLNFHYFGNGKEIKLNETVEYSSRELDMFTRGTALAVTGVCGTRCGNHVLNLVTRTTIIDEFGGVLGEDEYVYPLKMQEGPIFESFIKQTGFYFSPVEVFKFEQGVK